MADYIKVEKGCPPWQPAPDAAIRKILQSYSIPLCGVTSQHGVDYAFWCILGQAEESNLWAYTLLPDVDARQLLEAEPGDTATILREVTGRGGGGVIAFATDDAGIVFSAHYEGDDLRFGGPVGPALHVLQESIKAETERLTAAQEEIDSLAGAEMAPQFALAAN